MTEELTKDFLILPSPDEVERVLNEQVELVVKTIQKEATKFYSLPGRAGQYFETELRYPPRFRDKIIKQLTNWARLSGYLVESGLQFSSPQAREMLAIYPPQLRKYVKSYSPFYAPCD